MKSWKNNGTILPYSINNVLYIHIYEISHDTPTVNPTIECGKVTRNSVDVRVSDPPVFQEERFHSKDIRIESVVLQPIPEDIDSIIVENYRRYIMWDSEHGQTKPTTQIVTFYGNIPGRRYRIYYKMNCSSGEEFTYIEKTFASARLHCKFINNILFQVFIITIFLQVY